MKAIDFIIQKYNSSRDVWIGPDEYFHNINYLIQVARQNDYEAHKRGAYIILCCSGF